MSKFNNGRPYHGSEAVKRGNLQGATDTDYFYFFCPKCSDRRIMRILDYGVHQQLDDNPYNDSFTLKAKGGFVLAFKLHCEKCGHTDFVKISNMARQTGTCAEAIERVGHDNMPVPTH